jgi:iron complex outermembrane receptor protein
MNYTDQLVLTGAISDVGAPIRANVGKSFRTGIEVSGTINLSDKISWTANSTFSRNRNRDYTWLDADNNTVKRNTTIILSPSLVAGSQLRWKPFSRFEANILTKYVGKQFLDNSEDPNVALDAYLVNDLRFSYQFMPKSIRLIEVGFLINNVLDAEYASNGYGYGGVPYFYPQAGINFLAMLTVKL